MYSIKVSKTEPRDKNLAWVKPLANGYALYLYLNGAWTPIKLIDDNDTDSTLDDKITDIVNSFKKGVVNNATIEDNKLIISYNEESGKQPVEIPIVADIDIDSSLSSTSENPVQNKVIKAALDNKLSGSQLATINGSRIDQGGNVTIVAAEGQTITIDAAPTQGSNNAVSSGGVYSVIYGKNGEQRIDPTLEWTNGYINKSGNLSSPSGQYKYSNVIELQAGESAVAKAAGNGVAAIGVWSSATTNSSTLIDEAWMSGVTQITEYRYTATTHCYIRFGHNFAISGSDFYIGKQVQETGIVDDIGDIDSRTNILAEEMSEVGKKLDGQSLNNTISLSPTWIRGYLTQSGAPVTESSGSYYYSEPIMVNAGDIVRCHVGGAGISVIALYSLQAATSASVIDTVINSEPIDSEHPNDYEFTCPVWGYIRLCYNSGAVTGESWQLIAQKNIASVYKDVIHLKISAWNFGLLNHGVQTEGQIGIPDADVAAILPSLKQQLVNIAADVLYVTEYSSFVDRSGTMDTYETLLKQFYPYKAIVGNKSSALFSKYPFSAAKFISLDGRIYIDGTLSLRGKDVHIFLMHPRSASGQSGVDTRVADINQVITYLQDEPYVIVAGDMNTYEVSELDSFKAAGYVCGNCGYQGNIITYPDQTREWYIDNIIVRGFNMDNFEVIENTSVSDHYPVKAEISAYL